MPNTVFSSAHPRFKCGLGDAIALANYVYEHGGGLLANVNPYLHTVLASDVFDFEGKLEIVDATPNNILLTKIWDTNYPAVREHWKKSPEPHKHVCVHWEGTSLARDKNATPAERADIYQALSSMAIDFTDVGSARQGLAGCAAAMRRSDALICCLSSMYVLGTALGLPRFVFVKDLPGITIENSKVHQTTGAVVRRLPQQLLPPLKKLYIDLEARDGEGQKTNSSP